MNKKTTYTIAKYKPWLYLPQWGSYQGKEFTSVSDIGYGKDGMIVTVNDYLYWENKYIAFIMDIINDLYEKISFNNHDIF